MSGAPSGRAIILALAASAASALCAPALAQSQNTLFGGSVELRAAYAEGSGSANPYRAELLKLGSAELGPPSSRFKLSYEVLAAAGGEPRLTLEQAYLALPLGRIGRIEAGRREFPLGGGILFQAVDPLADERGRSPFDGAGLVVSPLPRFGLKAFVAMDELLAGREAAPREAWRSLLFGLRVEALAGPFEPGLMFFYQDAGLARLAASSRLAVGPLVLRLEGAWDHRSAAFYPTGDAADPPAIGAELRERGGPSGMAGLDLYLYPGAAALIFGVEYAYQSRGFTGEERSLAGVYELHKAGQGDRSQPAWATGGFDQPWDARHRAGAYAVVQPAERLSFRAAVVSAFDYPGGAAYGAVDAEATLAGSGDAELVVRLRRAWRGVFDFGGRAAASLTAGLRLHY